MAFGIVGIYLLGLRQKEEEEEWAGLQEWNPDRVDRRRRSLENWIARPPDADNPWAEQYEVDLARAAEKPSFFGLSQSPTVEIPDVDTSPTMERNVMVEELRRSPELLGRIAPIAGS